MKIVELIPLPRNKVHFQFACFKLVPKDAGCYALTTFDNDILYIGFSNNLFVRFQQHLNNLDKTDPTGEGKAIWFYFDIYDPKNLPEFERTWLNQFTNKHGRRPILNKIDSPVG
jgi:hypothetical protein